MADKLHPARHWKNVNDLTPQQRQRLRQLLDTYIATQDPVGEHHRAGNDMTLDIHLRGFLAWHTVFIAKLEQWLVLNGGGEFVPLPYYDPDTAVPAELNRNNTQPQPPVPFPAALRPGAILAIPSHQALVDQMIDYHGTVHDRMGGLMPFPQSSPTDPIFYPYHAFLLAVYEHWRNH